MSVNFDKHSVEKRHNKRFLGIFLMFVVVAAFVGVFIAMSISAMTGYGLFNFLQKSTPMPDSSTAMSDTSGGQVITTTTSTNYVGGDSESGNVTYQGVLEMLNKCFIVPSEIGKINTTCNQVCASLDFGACVNGFIVDSNTTHNDRPVTCSYPIWRNSHKLYCNCCDVPGNRAMGSEMSCEGICQSLGYSPEVCYNYCHQVGVA